MQVSMISLEYMHMRYNKYLSDARCGKTVADYMDVDALNKVVDLEDPEAEENSETIVNGDDKATLSTLEGSEGKGKGIERFFF